jgi:hypothetical protein
MAPDLKHFLGEEDTTTLTSYLDSPKFVQVSTNASRLVNKLKFAVDNQELYETQQILRTIYFRFINNPEKVDALTDLLYYGAHYLIEHGEHNSGQDVATLFLETSARRLHDRLENSTESNEHESVQLGTLNCSDRDNLCMDICRKLSSIAVRLPDTEIGQTKFIAEVMKLLSPKIMNRDLLHEVLANRFYQVKDYANARYHFLHSACKGKEVIHLLVDFQQERGTRSEVDLFITQFVLQFLCLQNPIDSPVVSTASGQSRHQRNNVAPPNLTVSRKSLRVIKQTVSDIFVGYTSHNSHLDPSNNTRPYKLPLLNFISLLISILDQGKSEADAFKFLFDTYEKALSRDPNYQSYLNRIGVLYFGLSDPSRQQQQHASGGGGFFNNILMSLLDVSDDEEQQDAPARPTGDAMSYYDELD